MDGRIQIGTQQVRHHDIELKRIQFPCLHRHCYQEIQENRQLKMTSKRDYPYKYLKILLKLRLIRMGNLSTVNHRGLLVFSRKVIGKATSGKYILILFSTNSPHSVSSTSGLILPFGKKMGLGPFLASISPSAVTVSVKGTAQYIPPSSDSRNWSKKARTVLVGRRRKNCAGNCKGYSGVRLFFNKI